MVKKIIEILDSDKDGQLSDLELGFAKKDFESLQRSIESKHSTLKDKLEKKGLDYVQSLGLVKKMMGDNFFNLMILGKEISVGGQTYKAESVPTDSIVDLIDELLNTEFQKDMDTYNTMVLSIEELMQLHGILSSKEPGKVKEFVKKQSHEPIKTSEVLSGSAFEEKMTKLLGSKEKAIEFSNNLDFVWKDYIKTTLGEDFPSEVIDNMASGMSFAMLRLLKGSDAKSVNNFLGLLKNVFNGTMKMGDLLESIKSFSDFSFASKLGGFMEVVKKYANENKSRLKKNKLLMNPKELSECFNEYFVNRLDDTQLKDKLEKSYTTKNFEIFNQSDIDGLTNIANNLNITKETVSQVNGVRSAIEGVKGMKSQLKEKFIENKEVLLNIKDALEDIGVWKFVKSIFDWICKMFGWKNGFDDFEKEQRLLLDAEKSVFNSLIDGYKKNRSANSSKEDESLNGLISSLNLDQEKGKSIKDFRISTFKKTLEDKSEDLKKMSPDSQRFGKYSLPIGVILASGKDVFKPAKDGSNQDQKEIDDSKFTIAIQEEILNSFITKGISNVYSKKGLVDKVSSNEDLAGMLYLEFVKPGFGMEGLEKGYVRMSSDHRLEYGNRVTKETYDRNVSEFITANRIGKELYDKIKGKKLSEIEYADAEIIFRKIFGDGKGTDLFIKQSAGSSVFLTRTLSVAHAEGSFAFGRMNPDKTQYAIGTFQISEAFRNSSNPVKKYLQGLEKGLAEVGGGVNITDITKDPSLNSLNANNYQGKMAEIQTKLTNKGISLAQQDLLSWYGYILSWENGRNYVQKLKDPSVKGSDLIELIYGIQRYDKTAQGGGTGVKVASLEVKNIG